MNFEADQADLPPLTQSPSPILGAGQQRVVLLILASVQFTSIVDFMVVMPLGQQLMRTLRIGPGQFGIIVSSYTIAAGVAALLAASMIDQFDRKTSFLTTYSGFLVGTLFCGLAGGYHQLLAARVLTGSFGGILGGMALAIIGDVFPEERRGTATGALMSAFAVASVLGVPFGLSLGTEYGWRTPFLLLAGGGVLILLAALKGMPRLTGHLNADRPRRDPLAEIVTTLTHPHHVRAFSLIVTLMFGSFMVIPYISPYLVANVGVTERQLPWVYVAGGALTLVGAPIVGRLADRHGKLFIYRCTAPLSGLLMLAVTLLPPVSLWIAVVVTACLMLGNASRMIAAMAMIMASVEPSRRGGFMTANASIQHLATGLGAYVGGLTLIKAPDGSFQRYPWLGLIALVTTLISLYLAGRIRAHDQSLHMTPSLSLGVASEAMGDSSDPLAMSDPIS